MVYLWFWSYWFSCGACGVRLAVLEQHNSLGFSSLTKRLHGQTLYTTLDTQCRLSILMCHGFIGVLLKWNKWNATGDENGQEKVLWETLTKILRENGNEAGTVLLQLLMSRWHFQLCQKFENQISFLQSDVACTQGRISNCNVTQASCEMLLWLKHHGHVGLNLSEINVEETLCALSEIVCFIVWSLVCFL